MGKFLRLVNGRLKQQDEVASTPVTIYDQSITVGAGGISSGTSVSLPSSQTYTSQELEVYLNGQRVDSVLDYNYVGSAPRTQISFKIGRAHV